MTLDRPHDRLLAFGELTSLRDALGNPTDVEFVQTARWIAAIARDERHSVALVEQLHCRFHTGCWQPELVGDLP